MKEETINLRDIEARFLAVILYPLNVVEGELVRLVVWLPQFMSGIITIGQLKELASYHPADYREIVNAPDGGICAVFDIRPRGSQELMESVFALKAALANSFHINSEPTALRSTSNIAQMLRQAHVSSENMSPTKLH